MKVVMFFFVFVVSINANNGFSISKISNKIAERMVKGNSYRDGCPVSLNGLRYLKVKHIDFNGYTKIGEIIVNKEVASNTLMVFKKLYEIGYPIKKMTLVSSYYGSDFKSIEADNTSAFNCRPVTGNKKKWSKHAYGKAIDINPIENPYISSSGRIGHKKSYIYRKRTHKNFGNSKDRAVLLPNDKATQVFKSYGWKWGGDWRSLKDYQHFYKPLK